jgi:hypothetical protein
MITRVPSVPAPAWPATGWEDAEVVDSVLVEEPPAAGRTRFPPREPTAGTYDRFGRVPERERCGRLVSILA